MADLARKIFYGVSIHVPVKDTTPLTINNDKAIEVSIHVPVKDTTIVFLHQNDKYFRFNPRTRKGYDIQRPFI